MFVVIGAEAGVDVVEGGGEELVGQVLANEFGVLEVGGPIALLELHQIMQAKPGFDDVVAGGVTSVWVKVEGDVEVDGEQTIAVGDQVVVTPIAVVDEQVEHEDAATEGGKDEVVSFGGGDGAAVGDVGLQGDASVGGVEGEGSGGNIEAEGAAQEIAEVLAVAEDGLAGGNQIHGFDNELMAL